MDVQVHALTARELLVDTDDPDNPAPELPPDLTRQVTELTDQLSSVIIRHAAHADNEVPMFQLQEALGHKSLEMTRRYYTTSKRAMARGFYKAFGATYS